MTNAILLAKKNYPSQLLGLSEDFSSYKLNHFNLNPEIYIPDAGSFAQLSLTFKSLKVSLFQDQ